MNTLKEFSDYLYNFHKEEEYKTIEDLYKKAEKYFINGINLVNSNAFISTRVNGKTGEEKKSYIINWISPRIKKLNNIIKAESNNSLSAYLRLYNSSFASLLTRHF